MLSIIWVVMPGSTEEAIAAAFIFLKAKQKKENEQKKKAKKLDKRIKKMKKLSKFKKRY